MSSSSTLAADGDDHASLHEADEKGVVGGMYLTADVFAFILFKNWRTKTSLGLLAGCTFAFILSFLYEGCVSLRECLLGRYFWLDDEATTSTGEKTTTSGDGEKDKGPDERTPLTVRKRVERGLRLCMDRSIQVFLYFVQAWLGLLIMLLAMTFNVYVCLAITVGKATGYLVFTPDDDCERATRRGRGRME